MKTINTIGSKGCACGDYESDNLIAVANCRKSGISPDSSLGVAHKLTYNLKTDDGVKEIGAILNNMFGYGADYIRVEEDEDLKIR